MVDMTLTPIQGRNGELLEPDELRRELKKPGRVYVPMLLPEDVRYFEAIKADIAHDPPMCYAGRDEDGDLWLSNFPV